MGNEELHKCKNCGSQLKGKVCYSCGQRVIEFPWTTGGLLRQFFSQLTNIEKGFLYTTRQMFGAPGRLVRDYWNGRTIPYYNPFRFVIIWTAINLAIAFWLGMDELIQANMPAVDQNSSVDSGDLSTANQYFNNWFNILVLLIIPVKSFMSYLLFRKRKQNYAEHLLMNSFIFGQGAFMSVFIQFIFYSFPAIFSVYFLFNFLVGLTYDSYVFRSVFKEKLWLTVLKALLIGVVGLTTLFVLIYSFSYLILKLV